VVNRLRALLADKAMNQYAYEGFQADESEAVVVSDIAAQALIRLGNEARFPKSALTSVSPTRTRS